VSKQRWHIGQNMPGYIPNEDPYCLYGTEDEAKHAARDEAIRALDYCNGDCFDHMDEAERPEEHTVTGDLDTSGDYWLDESDCGMIGSGGLHIWYAQCDEPEECQKQDHAEHNCQEDCPFCEPED
jgi:hypothetical protein